MFYPLRTIGIMLFGVVFYRPRFAAPDCFVFSCGKVYKCHKIEIPEETNDFAGGL
jgi:hypothetical protein